MKNYKELMRIGRGLAHIAYDRMIAYTQNHTHAIMLLGVDFDVNRAVVLGAEWKEFVERIDRRKYAMILFLNFDH